MFPARPANPPPPAEPRFRAVRVTPPDHTLPPAPPDEPPAADPGERGEPAGWSAAVRFPSPRAALGHTAATAELGPPGLRRSPDDHSVWALLTPGHQPGLQLAAGYGGLVHQADTDGLLWPDRPTARLPQAFGHLATVAGWEPVSLAELAAHSPAAAPPPGLKEVSVLAPGALGRWLLRRCLAAGVATTFTPVERLAPDGRPDAGWLLLRLNAVDGPVPAGLVEACGRLPGPVACRAADPDCRVLVDLRLRLPLDDAVLLEEVPPGRHLVVERALSGPPWQWRPLGDPAAGELLDARPVLSSAPPARTPVPVPALGPPLPVRLVASARAPHRVDAVLIADGELDALRRFLRTRPLHETAVVAFGPGRHLVTEPPGLCQALPFGIPVHQTGPGALYLESGCVLNPPLPDTARDEVLGLGPDVITVLCRDGAWRLRVADVRPAWQLWMPAPPAFAAGLSEPARELLDRLGEAMPEPEPAAPAAARTPEAERRRLNQIAMEHSLRGEYRRAAELLEQAGHFQRAAQMYERAAAELGEGL
ncbi:hypothetical protein AQI95_25335 [Streptomyces yokosukanensis]|uniref:FtsH ternary system domain-containing protein n=1 Tax=Streptomyces yokosukanensis TaxID=67386 RepID=A0A101P0X3_9ACTN|nr:hypothetical protein [Streptomyces yokosukanensis]KUN02858.1 hypothetical protein AQI95_25335 [Streptomyces yokosukanensis]